MGEGGGFGLGGGGQGGCEQRIGVFVKIQQKKNLAGGGGGGGVVGSGGGGRVGGVRVDVNEELKFLRKLKKKEYFFLGVVGVGSGGCRVGGGCRVRVDLNEKLKFLRKFGGGGCSGWGVFGLGGGGVFGWGGGVRMDDNQELTFL